MELYESRQDVLRGEIEKQVETVTGSRGTWPLRVEAGLPGTRIVRWAKDRGADLILLGIGRHRPVDRVFGTETALQVIRLSHVPVLAVPEGSTGLPGIAVLGVDFSHFSRRGAEVALGLLKPPCEAHLVHVMSGMEFLPTVSESWRTDYEEELRERLQDLTRGLGAAAGGCTLTIHLLEGEPAHELLNLAVEKHADLIVAGSHGLSFVGRLLMGSVSTRLVRGSHVPVLVIPPSEPAEEVLAEGDSATPHPWVKEMRDFSRLNVGRRTTLELNDPEVGAQECGRNFPLWGVTYDPKRDRIEIMLGRSGTVEGHLTHSIPGPRDLEVEYDDKGLAKALQIRLRQGQIVLRVHRD
jgi:nucleotide-binding universal stress UspA family protein